MDLLTVSLLVYSILACLQTCGGISCYTCFHNELSSIRNMNCATGTDPTIVDCSIPGKGRRFNNLGCFKMITFHYRVRTITSRRCSTGPSMKGCRRHDHRVNYSDFQCNCQENLCNSSTHLGFNGSLFWFCWIGLVALFGDRIYWD